MFSRAKHTARSTLRVVWRGSAVSLVSLVTIGFLVAGHGAQAEGVESEKTLRVGTWTLPVTQGNPYGGINIPGIITWAAMFDALTEVDENGTARPALAQSWENTKPDTWRFKIKPGLKFTNGEPVTAESVVGTLAFLQSDAGKVFSIGRETRNLLSVTAIDDLTVDVRTKTPDPILPKQISAMLLIEPKHLQDVSMRGYARDPVGTGSYRATSFAKDTVTLEAFEDSWRPPKMRNLKILELSDRAARLQALLSGQIDIALGLEPDNISIVEAAGFRMEISDAPWVVDIAFIQAGENKLFADERLRQAINYAVDKEAIRRDLWGGHGRVASQGATRDTYGYNPDLKPYPYDPEKAKQLLKEAGVPNGFSFVTEVSIGNSIPADSAIYQKIAQDLSKVGIEVEFRQITLPDLIGKFIRMTFKSDAFGLGWNAAPSVDAIRPYNWYSCKKKPSYFCDEGVMELVAKVDSEFDPDKRLALLQELGKVSRDNATSLFLLEQADFHAMSKKLKGWKMVNRAPFYQNMILED